MNRNNNILLKLLLILVLVGGWGGCAWAVTNITSSPAPTGGKFADDTQWYTIVYRGANNAGTYFNVDQNTNGELQWGSTSLDEGAYWCFVGNNTSGYKMYNLKTGVSMVLAAVGTGDNAHVKMVDAATANSDLSTFTTGPMTASGKTAYNFIRRGTSGNAGFNNNGGYVAMYIRNAGMAAGPNFAVEIQPATPPKLGNATLRFIDNKGANLPTASVLFTGTDGAPITLNAGDGTHDFGALTYSSSYFASNNDLYTISTSFAAGVLTFTFTADPNKLQFSDAPSATGWAPNTKWFYIQNNRSNQNAQYNYRYVSTAESSVNDNFTLKAAIGSLEGNRGEAWAFVGDENGFYIQNAAYGPDFVLGSSSSGGNASATFKMVRKDNPEGYLTTFTAVKNSTLKPGASSAYAFRVGRSGNVHIHITNGAFRTYDHDAINGGDTGSSFTITGIDDDVFNALPTYDVYHSSIGDLTYNGPRAVFGKRNTAPYIILASGGAEITKEHVTPNEDIESVSVTTPAGTYIKEIVVVKANEFSPAPINGEWAPGTKWFTLRNHRKGHFMSVSNAAVNDSYQLTWGVNTRPTNAEGMWCFVEDGANGFRIYNKAWGPDFVLGVESNSGNAHVRMYHKSEMTAANCLFSFVSSNLSYSGNPEHCIILGTSGNSNLNDISSSYPGLWTNNSTSHLNDTGSAFYLQRVDQATVSATTDYTAYKVMVQAEGMSYNIPVSYAYTPTSEMGSKTANHTTGHFILVNKDVTVDKSRFTSGMVPEDFTDYSLTQSSTSPRYNIITLTGNVVLPNILHRQSHLFTKLNAVSDDQLPGQGFIKKGDGMTTHPFNKDLQIQYTSNYTITQYIKHYEDATHTNRKQLFMPTIDGGNTEVRAYQRWYDYKNESMPNPDVINVQSLNSAAAFYNNGIVVGNNNSRGGVITSAYVTLPQDSTEYWLAVDQSRYNDGRNESNGDLTEPSITMRVIYHLVDAKVMADSMAACTLGSNNWIEQHTISYPNRKLWNGSNDTKSGVDYVGLTNEFSNYWCYSGDASVKDDEHLEQMVAGKLVVELDNSSTANLQNVRILVSDIAGIKKVQGFARNRFIGFQYPLNAEGNYEVPVNSFAIINVYMQNAAGTKFQLAKIKLTFIANSEPLLVSEVYGKDASGNFKSMRSKEALEDTYGNPVSQLTFDHPQSKTFECPSGNNSEAYQFPLDFKQSSYGYHGAPWASRGEYIFRNAGTIGGKAFYSIDSYKNVIDQKAASLSALDGKYFLYVDASEQPGQVMSIPIPENLCPGSRMYCYGWFNSATQISQESVGIVLNIVGKKRDTDETGDIIYSFNPGLLSTKAFDSNNQVVETVLGAAPWRQVGFSFLIDGSMAGNYSAYELQVMNNCYSTDGGDFTLDNFYIFVSPPKGEVDFTTPLCSDKVRHAKIYADYDMLRDLSGVNEGIPGAKITASYCFLDSVVFNTYAENGLAISDIFEKDSRGNHNLKDIYDISDPAIKQLINNAFGAALVGSRRTKETVPFREDHGFHSYYIDLNYENIPEYAYNDSKKEVIYREIDSKGVRRIVFKEDVVRGDMEKIQDTDGHLYYPFMRPSTTYYLVFAPFPVTTSSIEQHSVATDVFNIQESCSFLGTFTTKDPMHVILDNADIESDLPIKAVCHGETVDFSFDMPAMKIAKNYPIIDEAYCISDEGRDGEIVPTDEGTMRYRYEPVLKSSDVMTTVTNMQYDWWLGGELGGNTYRGTIEGYQNATHPTITYNQPEDIAHKQHGDHVSIAQAMEDFRFYYPEVDGSDWSGVTKKTYNNETGYGLLDSEIETIKDFVNAGIIVLRKNQYSMSLTADKSEGLTPAELSQMTSDTLNSKILELALELDNDPAIASQLPLKAIEGTVLEKLKPEGRKKLTFQEFENEPYSQIKIMAGKLIESGDLTSITVSQINTMPESELRKTVEATLKALPESRLRTFAMNNFTDIGPQKRAHLVIRALNIMSEETLADMTEAQRQDAEYVRATLRGKMIEIFSAQKLVVLKKMWSDVSAKLREEDRTALIGDKNPETMNETELGTLVEKALGVITDGIISDLNSDKYIHFTLIPIMPSQENYVDEPYIFCPDPRGVKIRITAKEPVMLDGFADMPYPAELTNVPVRLGLKQIKETKASASKTLRIPVRGLKYAIEDGVKAVKLAENTGYYNNLFLTKTNDPRYKQPDTAADTDGLTEAINTEGIYRQMAGTVESMAAVYPRKGQAEPDNYLVVKFKDDMKFREGYTYRIGINFMEHDKDDNPTISCYGTMLIDLKIVPEYQKWTATVNNDWTNDQNWARADRSELNADNEPAGSVIAGSTEITDAEEYPTNTANTTAGSFVPMYFTNVLMDNAAPKAAELYPVTAASRAEKKFLQGLTSDAATQAKHIYDMEVAASTGAWHTNGNYECGLFGTYVANGITFTPGAQLGNAYYLIYNKAWVEYELEAGRWYTIGSPLKASVAGDWYSPTDGGKQLTPHFYDISYDPAKNDRFRPAYYQRSWDRAGNNIVYEKSGGTYDSYVKADWSYVYNDAKVDYSNGGFSVKPELDYMDPTDRPDDGKVLVRLPKADETYTYYDVAGATGQAADAQIGNRTQSYRLISDDLGTDGNGTINMSVSNQTAGNDYLLLANPFMAAMDMDAFFAANPGLEQKYWIVDADRQDVSVKSADGTWITTGTTGGKYVAPMQGFFVKASGNSVSANYTADMQTVVNTTPNTQAPELKVRTRSGVEAPALGAREPAIRLTAERNGASSTALIILSEGADDNYAASEDCEAFIDGNLYAHPTVYTAAGTMAQTINVRKTLDMVPVGMISSDDSEATLRINIGEDITDLYLYDSEEESYTEVTDGTEVAMSGNVAGRYFLTTKVEDVESDTANTATINKGVYTISGVYIGESAEGLMPGIYVVDGAKMIIR